MAEVLRIILFISVLASSLHLSNSQTSDEDDERLKQVSGRRFFEVERSLISQLGGKESHERQCVCNVIIPGEKRVTVSEKLNPHQSPAERLVVYLYKIDGRVQLYIPTAEKQNLLPDLPLEDNDVLQEVGAKSLSDLMEDSPYVISKKHFKDIPDVDFELPKQNEDRYNIYLYKKSLQARLVFNEDPVQHLQFILGSIDRDRLPLSIIVKLKSLLQSQQVEDEYPKEVDETKGDYYESPFENHSHDQVTEYPFEPTTVRPDEEKQFDLDSLPLVTIAAAKLTDFPFEPSTVRPEEEKQLFDSVIQPFSTFDPSKGIPILKTPDYYVPAASKDESSSELKYFPEVFPSDKLPVRKVTFKPLVYELPQLHPSYETKPTYNEDFEPLLPAQTYPAPIDLHQGTSKLPNYDASPFYPGEQTDYYPLNINRVPFDNQQYPDLPDLVHEEESLGPFRPFESALKQPEHSSPADPKDESLSEPRLVPLVYTIDELPVPDLEPLEYELKRPYPDHGQELSYNQDLEALLPAAKYPETIDLYSQTLKPPDFEALPLNPVETSEYFPMGMNLFPLDHELNPEMEIPKFNKQVKLEFPIPETSPKEESLVPFGPLEPVSSSLDHVSPANPKDESSSEPKYFPQINATDELPINLFPVDHELNLELEIPKFNKQDKLEFFVPQTAPKEEIFLPFGPLEPFSQSLDYDSPADPKDESSLEPKYFPQIYATDELPVPNVPSLEPLVYKLPPPYPGYENYPAPMDLNSHSTQSPISEALPFYPGEQLEYLPSYPDLESPKHQEHAKFELFAPEKVPVKDSSVSFGPLKPVSKSPNKEYSPMFDYDFYPNTEPQKLQTKPSELFYYDEPTLYPDYERTGRFKPVQYYLEPSEENEKNIDYNFYPDEPTKFPYTSPELFDFGIPDVYPDEKPTHFKPIEHKLIPATLYPEDESIILEPLQPEVKLTKENIKPLEFELYPDIEPPKVQDISFDLDYVLPTDPDSANLDILSQFPDFDVLPYEDVKPHIFSEYPIKEKTQPPEDTYAFLKFLSSHQIPSWDQLLPEKQRPRTQQLTFDKWFARELEDIRKPENLNLYTVKITIENILRENQVNITADGILIDKYGKIINTGDLKLRPLLIGKPVGFKNLLNDDGAKKLKMSNSAPYLYSLLVSLGSPGKILGLIPLGVKSPKDSSEEFLENVEPSNAIPDYSSGVNFYPSAAEIAKPVSENHFPFSEDSFEVPEKSTSLPTRQNYPVTDTSYVMLDDKQSFESNEAFPDFSSVIYSNPSIANPVEAGSKNTYGIPKLEVSFEIPATSTELPTQDFEIKKFIANSDKSFKVPEPETSTEFLTPNIYTGTLTPFADSDLSKIPDFLPPEVSQSHLVSKLHPVEFSYDFKPNNPNTVEQSPEVSDHPYFSTTELLNVAEDVALKQLPYVHQSFPFNGNLDDSPYFQTTETPYVPSGVPYTLHPFTEVNSVTEQNMGSPEYNYPAAEASYTFMASTELSPEPNQPYTKSFEDKTPPYNNLLHLLTGYEPDIKSKMFLVFEKYPERFVSTLNKILSQYDVSPNLQVKQNIKRIVPVLESIYVTAQDINKIFPHLHEDLQVLYNILSNEYNIYPNFKMITPSLILPLDNEFAINDEPYSSVTRPGIPFFSTSVTPYYVTDPHVVTTSRPNYVTPNQYVTEPGVSFPTYTSTSYNTALYEMLLELFSSDEPDLDNQLLSLLEENPKYFIPTLVEILSRDDLNPKYLLRITQNIKAFIPRLDFAVSERKILIPNFESELTKLNTLLSDRPEFSSNNPEIPVAEYGDIYNDNPSVQASFELLPIKSQNINPNFVTDVSTPEDILLHDPNSLIELIGSRREDLVPMLSQSLQDPKLFAILSENYPQLDFKLISKYLNEHPNGYGDSNQNYRLQRLISYVYPRITKTQSQLVLPNLSKETLDRILTLLKSDPSIKVRTEVLKSAEPFSFDNTLNKAPENFQKYIVSPNVRGPINNVDVFNYKLRDQAPIAQLFGKHVQLAKPRIDFAGEFDFKDGIKVEKDIDVPEEQKVEEGPEFRIIGGSAATGSGAPLSNKGRVGIIA